MNTDTKNLEFTFNPTDFTDFFFVERFTQPVSPLGWSLIGKYIEKRALKEPLRYMGLFREAKGNLIYLNNGFPMVKKSTFKSLFQIVPKKLITKDKLNSFMEEKDLREINVSFVVKHLPFLIPNAVKDLNWFPFYHFYLWRRFKKKNQVFYQEFKEKELETLNSKDLLKLLKRLCKQTDSFLKLHRWSFIYGEVFYGILKGIVRLWIRSTNVDEEIEIAEKLCSGFSENVTAEMDNRLHSLAREIIQKKGKEYKIQVASEGERLLKNFLTIYGHRSESLDIVFPTWNEDQSFLIDMLNANIENIGKQSSKKAGDGQKTREETTRYCLDYMRSHSSWLVKTARLIIFKVFLKITQTFMILREAQRDEWQKILSQKRRVVLTLAHTPEMKSVLRDEIEIFLLTRDQIQLFLNGACTRNEIEHIIREQKKIQDSLTIQHTQSYHQTNTSENKTLKGIGVSMGKVRGRAVILFTIKEMKKLQRGDILVTKIIDSSWTPVFTLISGLITEVGGMLSHGAVVAREMRIPAVASIKNATTLIQNESEVMLDGKLGEVVLHA
jgi:phosphoenolpyruvate synthase/pyruvate phosphate dikinase